MPPYRLITLGPSHYCEKARWALERTRIPFEEEPHVPLLHYWATFRRRGRRTVPVLVTDSGVYPDSSEIVELADRHSSGALFGSGEERRLSKELEEHFDEKLGPHSRRVVYYHVLDCARLMADAFSEGVSKTERATFRVTLPAIVALMRRGMNIDSGTAARSRERAQAVFREVAGRLSDGRPFLTGQRFTAADLTFAALAAPLVLPPEYGWPMPPLESLPAPLQSEVRHFRDTVAGQFVLRVYREERHNVPPIGE
jgi:glutathione S-transferase